MDPISIRLVAELKAVLEELAGGDDRSLSSYINRALRQHVEALGRKLPIDRENAKSQAAGEAVNGAKVAEPHVLAPMRMR